MPTWMEPSLTYVVPANLASILPGWRILMHCKSVRGSPASRIHPSRCRLRADQDRRLVVIELDRHVVRRAFARFQHPAGTRVDQPILRRHPAIRIEERPRSTVLGMTEVQDARVEQAAGGGGHIPTGAGFGDRQIVHDLAHQADIPAALEVECFLPASALGQEIVTVTWLVGVQPPRPQTSRSVRDAHEGAGTNVAPGFVTLPPSLGDSTTPAVLIARFTVHDRLGGALRPHGRKTIRHVITHMPGLAGLEVQPVGVLVFVVAVMRPVVDAGGLTVRVPGVDLPTTGRDLWFGTGAITTGQVDGRAGTEASHQVPAVAGVVGGRHYGACDVESFPAESVEDRLQHGRDAMADK